MREAGESHVATRNVSPLGFVLALASLVALAWPTPTEAGLGPTGGVEPVRTAAIQDTLPAPAHLSWHPERPVQGSLFVLRVIPSPGTRLDAASGRAGGETLHFYRSNASGALESMAPAPVGVTDSVEATVTIRDSSGSSHTLTAWVPVSGRSFHHEKLTVAPELGGPLSKKNRARLAGDQAKAREVSRESEHTHRLWTHRVVLPRQGRVTGRFGDGRVFNGQVSSRHMGLDLDGEVGDTVVAAARGVVALVDRFLLAGNIVYLNHGAGVISGYFHLSKTLVEEGDTVKAGTPIGLVGATGRVTGPHLHWVVRYGTTSVDPRSLLDALGTTR